MKLKYHPQQVSKFKDKELETKNLYKSNYVTFDKTQEKL